MFTIDHRQDFCFSQEDMDEKHSQSIIPPEKTGWKIRTPLLVNKKFSYTLLNISLSACDKQKDSPPKNVCVLIPWTWVYVRLHSKGELRLLINWPWSREITLDYPEGPNVITRILTSGKERQKRKRERGVTTEVKSERCYVASFEDRGRSQEPGKVGSLQELEMQRNPFSLPRAFLESNPANNLIVAQWDPPWNSRTVKYKFVLF